MDKTEQKKLLHLQFCSEPDYWASLFQNEESQVAIFFALDREVARQTEELKTALADQATKKNKNSRFWVLHQKNKM